MTVIGLEPPGQNRESDPGVIIRVQVFGNNPARDSKLAGAAREFILSFDGFETKDTQSQGSSIQSRFVSRSDGHHVELARHARPELLERAELDALMRRDLSVQPDACGAGLGLKIRVGCDKNRKVAIGVIHFGHVSRELEHTGYTGTRFEHRLHVRVLSFVKLRAGDASGNQENFIEFGFQAPGDAIGPELIVMRKVAELLDVQLISVDIKADICRTEQSGLEASVEQVRLAGAVLNGFGSCDDVYAIDITILSLDLPLDTSGIDSNLPRIAQVNLAGDYHVVASLEQTVVEILAGIDLNSRRVVKTGYHENSVLSLSKTENLTRHAGISLNLHDGSPLNFNNFNFMAR